MAGQVQHLLLRPQNHISGFSYPRSLSEIEFVLCQMN